MLLEPDDELRVHLLTVIHGDDPQPSLCTQHSDTQNNRHGCETCNTFHLWYRRMKMRFTRRGLQFRKPTLPPQPDSRPPACPASHAFSTHYGKCEWCAALKRWDERQYSRGRRRGQFRSVTDLTRLLAHLNALERHGMLNSDIAGATGGRVSTYAIRELRIGKRTQVYSRTFQAIMAVPVPDRPEVQLVPGGAGLRRSVDGTGTRRRLHAARRNGWPLAVIAEKLGWPKGTVRNWAHAERVPLDAADAVTYLYPHLIKNPGGNSYTASLAATEGRIEARYFSEANIDDPDYDPFRMTRRTWGLHRRLRALAWLGHGPDAVGSQIGEAGSLVRVWMLGGPAPAYVSHMVAELYERWSFSHGSDEDAAALARSEGWASPLAWDDVNMDKPSASPRVRLPANSGKSSHVLTSVVFDAIDGKVPASGLLREEKIKVVWTLHRRGWSDRRIGAWLRWSDDADRARAAVTKFREREGISGFGIDSPAESKWEGDHNLILFGAAA